jgi:NADH:ubiquinone oxidoreductase subunit 6 (subunit J)
MRAERRSVACNYMVFLGLFETIAALYVMSAKPPVYSVVAILVVAIAPAIAMLRAASIADETPELEVTATLR